MAGIGPLELGIVLLILLVVFGPKRLPGLGRSLGSGMREFKDSISGKDSGADDDDDDDGRTDRPALTRASPEDPADPVVDRTAADQRRHDDAGRALGR